MAAKQTMQAPFDIAADLDTPVSAYLKLKSLRPRFLLESVEGGERLARYSFLGFGDAVEVRMDSSSITIAGKKESRPKNQQECPVARGPGPALHDPPPAPPQSARSGPRATPAVQVRARRSALSLARCPRYVIGRT